MRASATKARGVALVSDAQEPFDAEHDAVKPAPSHECPLRSVPQTTQQHRNHQIAQRSKRTVAAAAKRDVEIVAQPGR
jgi:hypothetical protein